MEVNRQKSRVVIQDPVYQKMQDLRYSRHLRALQNLHLPFKKCSSEYLTNKHDIAAKLDRYKQAQRLVKLQLDPIDREYRNCQRRLQHVEGGLKLPRIGTLKMKENKLAREEEAERIRHQNYHLHQSIAHLSLQKSQERKAMAKSIQAYELYRKLSRRVKSRHGKQNKAETSQSSKIEANQDSRVAINMEVSEGV